METEQNIIQKKILNMKVITLKVNMKEMVK